MTAQPTHASCPEQTRLPDVRCREPPGVAITRTLPADSVRSVFPARLAGFEPTTCSLEGTASEAGTVHDVHFFGLMTRYQSARAGTVATGMATC